MIKSWKLYLESYNDDVSDICNRYKINKWSINPDTGLVDVDGNVNLFNRNLTKLPLNFGEVNNNFWCNDNNLSTLEGCPRKVGSNFYCINNQLTSLEHCPYEVGGSFYCAKNKLVTLIDCPYKAGDIFNCDYNQLVNLEGLNTAKSFSAFKNPITYLGLLGQTMIDKKISFLESVILNIDKISTKELVLIMSTIDPQSILELNDFKLFNTIRTHLPQKYVQVMKLRNVDLSSDLGELGF